MNKNYYIVFGVILVFAGFFAIFNNYFSLKKAKVYDTISLSMSELPVYIENDNINSDNNDNDIDSETNNNDQPENNLDNNNEIENNDSNYYIGKLEIPKINLSRGFASIDSKYNNVDKNIVVIKGSSYPDVLSGNLIIAGHSGNGWNCFFNNLPYLKNGDIANVYYKDVRWVYKLVKTYQDDKDGSVRIYRNKNVTTLTLITCTKGTKDKQSVYIFELIRQETY